MFTWEGFLFWEAFHQHLPTSGPGGTTKLAARHAQTHTGKYAQVVLAFAVHKHSAECSPCLAFLFYSRYYFMPLHTSRGLLQSNRSITVKQWTFHGSITYCGNKLLYRSVRKSMLPWVRFTNHLLFALHNAQPPICWKMKTKEKKKKTLRHQAYLWICMHSNSYPELPKLRITRFWIKGERKIIHKKTSAVPANEFFPLVLTVNFN